MEFSVGAASSVTAAADGSSSPCLALEGGGMVG